MSAHLLQRLLVTALGASSLAAMVLVGARLRGPDRDAPQPIASHRVTAPSPLPETEAPPISAEALVFRSTPMSFAVDPGSDARRPAHPRTLATFRGLRAFPGAPPRVPHGLTIEEHRRTSCRTCHDRGGFSQRFGAYAPVAPHPELPACLQCHLADDALIGVPLPAPGDQGRCRQCHAPGATTSPSQSAAMAASSWTGISPAPANGPPPAIPHDLQMRGDCLACHAGPGAVAEVRTTHPERADCRGCHLLDAEGQP